MSNTNPKWYPLMKVCMLTKFWIYFKTFYLTYLGIKENMQSPLTNYYDIVQIQKITCYSPINHYDIVHFQSRTCNLPLINHCDIVQIQNRTCNLPPHKSLWHSSNSKQNMLPPHRSANGFYINRYNSDHCYSIDIWDHCVCNDFVLHEEMYECVSI